MSEKESTRKKNFKFLGLSAGASLVSLKMLAGIIKPEDIRKLNPRQQEFMVNYGKWLDEFIDVIRIQKVDCGNSVNNKKMIVLTERTEAFKPKLSEYLKDANFSMIYKVSIERMSKEI